MFEHLTFWIGQYGYTAIFSLLVAGIVGVPVPDQLLLVLAGYGVLTGSSKLWPALAAAVLGSICGISLSYLFGRTAGSYLVNTRFGRNRLETARRWFEKHGSWTLVFGYFIPGIRNLIGFVSGMMRLKVRHFMPYAYAGAVISSVTCVLAGYFIGVQATWLLASIGRVAILGMLIAGFFLVKKSLIPRQVAARRVP